MDNELEKRLHALARPHGWRYRCRGTAGVGRRGRPLGKTQLDAPAPRAGLLAADEPKALPAPSADEPKALPAPSADEPEDL